MLENAKKKLSIPLYFVDKTGNYIKAEKNNHYVAHYISVVTNVVSPLMW